MMTFAKLKMIFVLAASGALPLVLLAQTNPSRQPLARIGDQAIYEEDLLPSIGAQLNQLKTQEYELKIKALKNVLNQRLLENEAKSKGLSADVFLEQAVDRRLPAPGAGEVEAYYLAQKDRLAQPFTEVKVQLEQALAQARLQQARQDFIDRLRQTYAVSILLSRPRVEVMPDSARLLGDPYAPITIVEFADFQCPYCRTAEQTLKQVLEKYRGQVRLSFRDLPLRQIHPQAQAAAEAARCAGDQGKFWEYHDLLLANQGALNPSTYADDARNAGLDVPRFQACLESGRFRPLIENDLQSGFAAGVSGTPAFYINGVMLSGAQPLSEFERIIESELANARSRNPER